MENQNEKLLDAWLLLSTAINNPKIVSDMPYNEAHICNLLCSGHRHPSQAGMTATELCRQTKMLKSQMNRTLQSMEQKQLITRVRSDTDRRQVFVRLNPNALIYKEQHAKILTLIDRITAKIGPEKSRQALELFTLIADTAEEVIG